MEVELRSLVIACMFDQLQLPGRWIVSFIWAEAELWEVPRLCCLHSDSILRITRKFIVPPDPANWLMLVG